MNHSNQEIVSLVLLVLERVSPEVVKAVEAAIRNVDPKLLRDDPGTMGKVDAEREEAVGRVGVTRGEAP